MERKQQLSVRGHQVISGMMESELSITLQKIK